MKELLPRGVLISEGHFPEHHAILSLAGPAGPELLVSEGSHVLMQLAVVGTYKQTCTEVHFKSQS